MLVKNRLDVESCQDPTGVCDQILVRKFNSFCLGFSGASPVT